MNTPYIPLGTTFGSDDSAIGSPAVRARGAKSALPPPGNTGGKDYLPSYTYTDPVTGEISLIVPTNLPYGECLLVPITPARIHPYAAITDYFNTTFKFDQESESLADLFQELFAVLGEKFAPAIERAFGKYNYKKSYQLGSSSALLCIGGQAGTVLVSLPGGACSLLSSWPSVVDYFANRRNARITRWDGAVDEYFGLHSVDWAAGQYLIGNFQCGGNKPSCKNAGNWTDPDGKGRTFYVGNRKNGKIVRIYEKGQQLGFPWHPWVRWEVELHNVDRVIPWDVLLEPGRYLVGSYPKVLSWVQDEMTPIRTIQKQQQIGYEHLTACLKNSFGPMLNVMRQVEGSDEAVMNKLVRPGTPRRLQHPAVDEPSDFIE